MKYIVIACLLVPTPGFAKLKIPPRVKQALTQAAEAHQVSVRLLSALCFKESSFRARVINTHDGDGDSYGLCQIQEYTARDMGFTGNPRDLLNPFINAYYAAKFLRHQLDRYNGDWINALSAYNAGKASPNLVNRSYIKDILNIAVEL